MRLIQTNVLNTVNTLEMALAAGAKKYFCVSTDKAANPVNMMGASKRIMELFLASKVNALNISTARFALFSDGSLLRLSCELKSNDWPQTMYEYFVTPQNPSALFAFMSPR